MIRPDRHPPAGQRSPVGLPLRARVAAWLAAVCLGAATFAAAQPNEARPATDDPVLEARVMKLSAELRCLVCQNETIAGSNADLAVDLRNQVREMLRDGASEADVMTYMTDRYGDFVRYRPPLKGTTVLLWFGPALLLVIGATVLVVTLRRRSRLGAEHFEPDDDDQPGDTGAMLPAQPTDAAAPPPGGGAGRTVRTHPNR